jgi:hypothetical protein
MSYTWNKLQLAVHCLASAGSQRERLAAALAEHLACLRPKDLPSGWQAEFALALDRLCLGRVLEQEASVRRIVDALDDEDVDAMISSILRFYDAVTRYQPLEAAKETTSIPAPLLLDEGDLPQSPGIR